MNNQDAMKAFRSEICATVISGSDVLGADCENDFILPDYLDDIARLLRVSTRLSPIERFRSADKLELAGRIIYDVVYEADSGRLSHAQFSSEYEADSAVASADDSICIISPYDDPPVVKLLNPRKLSIKSRIRLPVVIYERRCIAPRVTGEHTLEDELTLERSCSELSASSMSHTIEGSISGSYKLELEGSLDAIAELIRCDAVINPYECREGGGNLLFKGDLIVNILYRGEGGGYITVSRRIPLSESISDSSGCEDGFEPAVVATISELSGEIAENSYGEKRIIELELEYSLEALCSKSTPLEVVKDAYSTAFDCELSHAALDIVTCGRGKVVGASLNESRSRAECSAEGAVSVIDAYAALSPVTATPEPQCGKLILESKCAANLICEAENGFSAVNVSLPVHLELDVELHQDENETFSAAITITGIKGRLDSDRVYFDLELSVRISTLCIHSETIVSSIELDHSRTISSSEQLPLTLYYPHRGETLWEIAKRFSTTTEAIAEANELNDSESVTSRNVLIVPRRGRAPAYKRIING